MRERRPETIETSRSARIADTLFGPIDSRERAAELARVLAAVVVVLALVEGLSALVLGPLALLVAALEAALAALVAVKRSVVAAVSLLALSTAAAAFVLVGLVRAHGAYGGWTVAVALIGVWAGGRAVQGTIAFRRARSRTGRPS